MASLLETLGSYVPALIVRRWAEEKGPGFPRPTARQGPTAAFFADIKGFTALTERLAARGPAGAEDLTRILNEYLGQLVDLVTAHGGDVVKFAGDAVVALWDADRGGITDAVRRSAACALAVQARLHDYQVAGDVRLSMKLAIAAGEVHTMTLGGVFERWELLVAGTPLEQLSKANALGLPGQTVLSPQAWSLLTGKGTAAPVNDGEGHVALENVETPPLTEAVRIALPPEAAEAVRAFVPAAIRRRLDAGQSDWLAELRQVSVVFVNLPEMNHLMPLERAQETMAALQMSLYRFEGSINKISVDDKGASLVAALGLPPLAHEDDAVRAVRAAEAMHEALQRLGQRSSIGVTTGQAFCGSVGSATRREYTLMGDVVNLAARLMQAADGGVLCDRATAEAAGRRKRFTALAPLSVKGKQERVPVFRPSPGAGPAAAAGVPRRAPEIVERERERELLASRIDALLAKAGAKVLIEGEPGIGKSLLLQDMLDRARARHVAVLTGAADSVETTTPYFAFRPVFARVLRLEQMPADPADRQTYVMEQLPSSPRVLRLAPLLGAVLPFEWPDNEFTAQMVGKLRADHVHELLAGLLSETAAQSPLLLAIEDGQWLDAGSLALLEVIEKQVRPLLLVVTTRPLPDPVPPELSALLRDAEVLHLERLSPEASLALACRGLGVKELPPEVAQLVQDRAEGSPFFSEELVYAMRDAGLIVVEGEKCRIRPGAGEVSTWSLPQTVQGVIVSRIDRLTAQQQLTLKVSSVIGRTFAYRTLYEVHPIAEDRHAMAENFDVLHRLELTKLEVPEPELAYMFKHAITHEVAYNLLPYEQRRRLHREVAQWYEKAYAADLAPLCPLLAHHWRRAAEDRTPDATAAARAIDYLQRAGDQAARGFLEQAALRSYQEGIHLTTWLPEGPERTRRELELQLSAGALMIATKGYAAEEVRQAYARARNLCQGIGDRGLLFRALRGLWAFHIGRAEFEEAIVLSRQLLRLAEEDGGSEVRMEAHRAMGNAIFWIGDLTTARDHMQSGIELYVEDRDRTLAFLYGQDPDVANRGMQAWPLALQGQTEEALRRGEQAIAHARELGHPYTLGYALVHDMCCRQFLLQVETTLQRAEETIALASAKFFPNWLLVGMVLRGWALGRQGKAREGLELMTQGVGLWRSFGSELAVPYLLALQAEVLCLARREEEGLKLLQEALAVGQRNNDHWYEAETHRLQATCLRQTGRKTEAEAALRSATAVAERQGAALFGQRAATDLVELLAGGPESGAPPSNLVKVSR